MSNKSISEALAAVQRKVNEQRTKNAETTWETIEEKNYSSMTPAEKAEYMKQASEKGAANRAATVDTTSPTVKQSGMYMGGKGETAIKFSKDVPNPNYEEPGYTSPTGEVLAKAVGTQKPASNIGSTYTGNRNNGTVQKEPVTPTQQGALNQKNLAAPKPPAPTAPTPTPTPTPAPAPVGSGRGSVNEPAGARAAAQAPKPAAPKAPQAQSSTAAAAPADPHAKSKSMFNALSGDNDTSANFFAADAQRQKELGGKAPNDFSSEEESGGKTKGKKKMSESALINSALNLIGKENMFEAAKKAKKDYDGDGKVESGKDEYLGSKIAAAKKAGKIKDYRADRDKHGEMEEAAYPPGAGKDTAKDKDPDMMKGGPDEAPKSPIAPPKEAPMPPKKPAGMKEETDPGFSEAELAHIASIMEAPTDANKNYKVNAKGNEVGTGATTGDLTDETVIGEARGRPKGSTKADVNPNTEQGRDPRQHIQVIAGQAAAGRVIDFKHNNGEVSKISPGMGRKIDSHLNSLKPADKQAAVNKMHDSAEGLKI